MRPDYGHTLAQCTDSTGHIRSVVFSELASLTIRVGMWVRLTAPWQEIEITKFETPVIFCASSVEQVFRFVVTS